MIHPTALVHKDAKVDPSAEVGPWCSIGPNVRIGKGTRLVSHVVVEGWTDIGEDNKIFPFAVLGAVPQDLKYKGEPTKLIIGNRNTIRESVTLNLGTVGGGGMTEWGYYNLLMAYVHLGHDCIVGNHCIIANYGGLAGHVTLQDYVTVGGQTGISQFAVVGAHSYVGAQSGIEKDVPPFYDRSRAASGFNPRMQYRRTSQARFHGRYHPEINEAIKLWGRPDVHKEQCLLEIESQYGEYPEIQQFVAFIRKSEIGVTR